MFFARRGVTACVFFFQISRAPHKFWATCSNSNTLWQGTCRRIKFNSVIFSITKLLDNLYLGWFWDDFPIFHHHSMGLIIKVAGLEPGPVPATEHGSHCGSGLVKLIQQIEGLSVFTRPIGLGSRELSGTGFLKMGISILIQLGGFTAT